MGTNLHSIVTGTCHNTIIVKTQHMGEVTTICLPQYTSYWTLFNQGTVFTHIYSNCSFCLQKRYPCKLDENVAQSSLQDII